MPDYDYVWLSKNLVTNQYTLSCQAEDSTASIAAVGGGRREKYLMEKPFTLLLTRVTISGKEELTTFTHSIILKCTFEVLILNISNLILSS